MKLVQGNEAVALAALSAGCNFYAGYPITPASEIMEWLARLLPKRDGVFLQMEDEISAIAAAIGASWAGAKAMTATSGPGFSLMQENLGYAAMTETPLVVVNSQRVGPSTGLPTLPSQGDVMQAMWGSHGDQPRIVLTASGVEDAYRMTVEAFNLSERYRVPVVLLLDAATSHMRENVELPENLKIIGRRLPAGLEGFQPFGTPEFLPLGEGGRFVVTGLAHDESGKVTASEGSSLERILKSKLARLDAGREEITHYKSRYLEDASAVILSYGITARAALAAVEHLREEGYPVGFLELMTLWPFPDQLIRPLSQKVEEILVPELNLGQLVWRVRAAAGATPVRSLGRADGMLFTPEEIATAYVHSEMRQVSHA